MPVNVAVLTGPFPGLTPYEQSIELSRLVLVDDVPFNGESWFVARCHHDLALAGIRGVVSFSDPLPRHLRDGTVVMPGHVGLVYPSLNFRYTGRTKAHSITLLPDGQVMHGRAKAKIRAQHTGHRYAERVLEDLGARPITADDDPAVWLRQALASIGAVNVRHPGNHRFCLTLGGRRHARHLALPAHPTRPTRGRLPARARPVDVELADAWSLRHAHRRSTGGCEDGRRHGSRASTTATGVRHGWRLVTRWRRSAQAAGVSRQTASAWLKRHGLQANHRPLRAAVGRQLAADYERTRSIRKLAVEYGISSGGDADLAVRGRDRSARHVRSTGDSDVDVDDVRASTGAG